MKKYAKHISVPEWLWQAIEAALHERLRELSSTFQMGMSARLGLYKPSLWDMCLPDLDSPIFKMIDLPKPQGKTITFFRK